LFATLIAVRSRGRVQIVDGVLEVYGGRVDAVVVRAAARFPAAFGHPPGGIVIVRPGRTRTDPHHDGSMSANTNAGARVLPAYMLPVYGSGSAALTVFR